MSYQFSVRVYYEDTDAAGIVYYANYLKFAERARTELLRTHGIEQQLLMQEHDVGFVVRKCSAEFFKPAMLDDDLTIETQVNDITKATIMMQQTIRRGHEKLVVLEVKLAVIAANSGRIAKMPEHVFAILKK